MNNIFMLQVCYRKEKTSLRELSRKLCEGKDNQICLKDNDGSGCRRAL